MRKGISNNIVNTTHVSYVQVVRLQKQSPTQKPLVEIQQRLQKSHSALVSKDCQGSQTRTNIDLDVL